jgi:toxin ParE1/3/4
VSDLKGIADYLRVQNARAARRVIQSLYRTFAEAGRNPELGTARDDLRKGLRAISPASPAHNYVVLTAKAPYGVNIVAVIHGARDWENLIADEG